jgi:hypothetical protein
LGRVYPAPFLTSNMKLLKQKTTGELYVWTEILAQREDMEEYIRTPVKAEEPVKTEEVIEEPPQDEIKALAQAVLMKRAPKKGK